MEIHDNAQALILLVLGTLFLVGLAADLIGRYTALPRVTLLLLGGVLFGPTGFSLLPAAFVDDWFGALTTIALSMVGFLLGQQLSMRALRARGAMVIVISLFKVAGAWAGIFFTLMLLGIDTIAALLLSGIGAATAPAAIYDLVHESGARGEFTEVLLSVVALDDVWSLLLFAILLGLAGVVTGDAALGAGVAGGVLEIGGSALLGIALGMPMAFLTGHIRRGEPMLAEAMGFVLLAAGLAEWFNVLPILTAMAMGGTVASLAHHHERPFHAIEGVEWPFMILFFVLAGASLEIGALVLVGELTIVYIIARSIGIYVGAAVGARVTGAPPMVRRWLGVALLPQAGVAIGMSLLASQRFPDYAGVILPVTLASTIVLEVLAPVVTRVSLARAGALPSG